VDLISHLWFPIEIENWKLKFEIKQWNLFQIFWIVSCSHSSLNALWETLGTLTWLDFDLFVQTFWSTDPLSNLSLSDMTQNLTQPHCEVMTWSLLWISFSHELLCFFCGQNFQELRICDLFLVPISFKSLSVSGEEVYLYNNCDLFDSGRVNRRKQFKTISILLKQFCFKVFLELSPSISVCVFWFPCLNIWMNSCSVFAPRSFQDSFQDFSAKFFRVSVVPWISSRFSPMTSSS
jgi:hypothetical protein